MTKPARSSAAVLNVNQLGQDTEFFLWDKKKEEVIPSYKHFPTKEEAPNIGNKLALSAIWPGERTELTQIFEHRDLKEKYWQPQTFVLSDHTPKVFRDGLAVEINTKPHTCRAYMYNNVRYGMWLSEPWKEGEQDSIGYTTRPWVEITHKMIESFPPDLLQLGCSPTMNAYTDRQQNVAVNPRTLLYRTSGAHLHMSFKSQQYGQTTVIPRDLWCPWIKVADLLLGVPFTYIFGDELEAKRRQLYGRAGEFRIQQYNANTSGIEYRVLSSRLWNHPGTFSLFVGIFKYLMGWGAAVEGIIQKWDPAWEDTIQQGINEVDPKALKEMLAITTACIERYGNLPGVPQSSMTMWDALREMNFRGAFPDAGFLDPTLMEGHKGISEWRDEWKLPQG